ncbi:MAG: hypothetical protein K0Q94_3970 [Paenibacillus sp.]|jgi:hypothetical protein|nr:hypothetical protein [Paenibacillus sp.]
MENDAKRKVNRRQALFALGAAGVTAATIGTGISVVASGAESEEKKRMSASVKRTVPSIAELRTLLPDFDGEVVYLNGRQAGSSIGAGNFMYVGSSTAPDDDGVTVGKWIRQYSDYEVDAGWFGVGNDGADYADELQAAIQYAAAAANMASGMRVHLPRGKIGLSRKILLPNRVAIHGANGRGTVIEALNGFTDDCMFHAHNGTSSMFGSRLVDLFIDMRGQGGANGRCIYSQAWQETCGLERVCLIGFPKYGLELSNGYGGAAYLPLKDIEIFGGSIGTNPTAGIHVHPISLVGGFVLSVDGATITGSSGSQLPAAIRMANDSAVVRGLHIEFVGDGIVMSGAGSLSVDTFNGSYNSVTNLIAAGSSFTGKISARNLIPNGATYIFKRNSTGYAITSSGLGMVPELTYPEPVTNGALAWAVFDASTTANGADATMLAASDNVQRVVKVSDGTFTLLYKRNLPVGERALHLTTNLNNGDWIKVSHNGSAASGETFQVWRNISGTPSLYNPQRGRITVHGNRF